MAPVQKFARLSVGLHVHGLTDQEAVMMYEQVLEYFSSDVVDVREGMTVWDVGAHFGLFALEVLRRTNGNVTLRCFEPSPVAYNALVRNIKEQFPESDVKAYQMALSDRNGVYPFYVRPFAPALSSLYKDATLPSQDKILELMRDPNVSASYKRSYPRWFNYLPRFLLIMLMKQSFRQMGKTEEIFCDQSTISDVLRQEDVEAIDVLKLDVEEAEFDVLLGIEQLDWPKVRALVAEIHDKDRRLEKIRSMLAAQGFDRILADQEYVFQGTDIYDIYASRN